MSDTLRKADATGKLELAGETTPMPYDVTAAREKDAGHYRVRLSVSVPRDWLLKRGFETSATLIREDGSKIALQHDGKLDVGQAVSVELFAIDPSCADDAELQRKYPELRV